MTKRRTLDEDTAAAIRRNLSEANRALGFIAGAIEGTADWLLQEGYLPAYITNALHARWNGFQAEYAPALGRWNTGAAHAQDIIDNGVPWRHGGDFDLVNALGDTLGQAEDNIDDLWEAIYRLGYWVRRLDDPFPEHRRWATGMANRWAELDNNLDYWWQKYRNRMASLWDLIEVT